VGKYANEFGFEEALAHLKRGGRVARHGWNGEGMFVYAVAGSQFCVSREPLTAMFGLGTPVTYRPHLDLRAADGTCGTWTPSDADLFAEDWHVVEPTKDTGDEIAA